MSVFWGWGVRVTRRGDLFVELTSSAHGEWQRLPQTTRAAGEEEENACGKPPVIIRKEAVRLAREYTPKTKFTCLSPLLCVVSQPLGCMQFKPANHSLVQSGKMDSEELLMGEDTGYGLRPRVQAEPGRRVGSTWHNGRHPNVHVCSASEGFLIISSLRKRYPPDRPLHHIYMYMHTAGAHRYVVAWNL